MCSNGAIGWLAGQKKIEDTYVLVGEPSKVTKSCHVIRHNSDVKSVGLFVKTNPKTQPCSVLKYLFLKREPNA
jgi:hypothetical protein